jgi:hypothetical protein
MENALYNLKFIKGNKKKKNDDKRSFL